MLNRKWISVQRISSATVISVMLKALTPHLLRVVGTTHCKEQRGNGVSVHRAAQAASLWPGWRKKNKLSFHALLAAVQTPSARVLSNELIADCSENNPHLSDFFSMHSRQQEIQWRKQKPFTTNTSAQKVNSSWTFSVESASLNQYTFIFGCFYSLTTSGKKTWEHVYLL